jgi:multisite-specific tRNA:(cytosine-C5)-methyltransferase
VLLSDHVLTWTVYRHALAVQQRLKDHYIPKITSITYEGQIVETPQAVPWYPDQLAWFMTTPKNVIRRFPPFASFQKFLVAESDVGNISRQEVVSMIPPLVMDLKPGMTVLDLCAAPGSKSAQLIEMVHAGEEERTREVAADLANGLDRPTGEDYADDGRSTGLLIANDVDYKRAHMLVHQMKRLSSPNIIVTNHDATIYPSIKLPSQPSEDGKAIPNRYLKFDRVLADVPCSGDGTSRKNIEIWRNWTPSNALGLHMTQVRILVRALQMLKVGGRVVYSTCSMNPVENEAVLAHAIDRCGGQEIVRTLDTSNLLPALKRYPGLRSWKVMDKVGRVWHSYQEVEAHRAVYGDEGLGRIVESMFPPQNDIPLERCMRVYPYQQDTGAFFIAILEKQTEIKARAEDKPKVSIQDAKVEEIDVTKDSTSVPPAVNGAMSTEQSSGAPPAASETATSPLKRKREDEDELTPSKKLTEVEENGMAYATAGSLTTPAEHSNGVEESSMVVDRETKEDEEVGENASLAKLDAAEASSASPTFSSAVQPNVHPPSETPYKTKRKNGQPFEEPFKYLDPDMEELEIIRKFYNISPRFPRDRFMVRNVAGTATKNIYYTTELAKSILQENEGKGMKFVHSGVKMFVKQDVPSPEICAWRIQTDGLAILEAWVGPERIVKLTKKETLRKLLIEMFPRFHGDDWKNLGEIGEQVRDIGMGCCVLRVEPTDEDGFRYVDGIITHRLG